MRWLACIACALGLLACGDDGGGKDPDDGVGTDEEDAGTDASAGGGRGGDGPNGGRSGNGGGGTGGGGETDAGMDAMPNPFDYDASDDYNNTIPDGAIDAGPAPEAWVCPEALWNDGICDCGCGAADVDCTAFSCSDPGCVADTCDACFSASQTWRACVATPDLDDWTCDTGYLTDSQCDCGCGIADPACLGSGCTGPACRKNACDRRHGCAPGTLTDATDDCSFNPNTLTSNKWKCAWEHYGSGDGCHCGCGAKDPDCDGQGCTAARCFDSTCDVCSDELGRPYPCAAAEAGWDDDAVEVGLAGNQIAQCNGLRFGANDGCDCGCGGLDPDCGEGEGCADPGCIDDACVRCTFTENGAPYGVIGCAPATWVDSTHDCRPESYGTGDGCDCGCGVPDPDCGSALGCTTPGCTHEACDVCNYGGQIPPYVLCTDRWTCTHPDVFNSSACDCGCGVIDPACREANRLSCTEAGCETEACDFCNDGGDRTACGGGFDDTNATCSLQYYGVDGLCDCGCGAVDPDCAPDEGCTEAGCTAPGCEVCHGFNTIMACPEWTCDAAAYGGGDGCDCGCGAHDPDCANAGCDEPGCSDAACVTCHDPFGRAVKCP